MERKSQQIYFSVFATHCWHHCSDHHKLDSASRTAANASTIRMFLSLLGGGQKSRQNVKRESMMLITVAECLKMISPCMLWKCGYAAYPPVNHSSLLHVQLYQTVQWLGQYDFFSTLPCEEYRHCSIIHSDGR